jgi:[methyl-Co(III) methanol-specific corrinoid protein]:coenzyme M methyltransferase
VLLDPVLKDGPSGAHSGEGMNKRERVLNAIRGEAVDRPPVLCVNSTATESQADILGLKWPAFHQSPEEMRRMGAGALDILDFDAVRVPFCQTIEAEALGCVVSYKDFIPCNDVPLYSLEEKPSFPEDFLDRGRIPALLEALQTLKALTGKRAVVMGGVTGPLTIARALLDSVPLLKASLKAPEKIIPFLEIGKRACLELSAALLRAGADLIVMEDMSASPDLLHPKTYKSIVNRYQKQVIEATKGPVILHVCGNVALIAEDLGKTGAVALSIDRKAETRSVREQVTERLPLIGGVETMALALSTPAEIRTMCEGALKEGIDLLAPGCAIPPNSPTENLRAMVQAAEEFEG